MSEYTDQERMRIAQKEYDEYNDGKPLKEGDQVTINHDKTTIGYVAEAIHNEVNGEDSYVITNTKDRSKATKVTVLYQGSTEPMDYAVDGVVGDQILFGDSGGESLSTTNQLVSSAHTLQKALDEYPNAHFELYGQSLGAMNGQYALVL